MKLPSSLSAKIKNEKLKTRLEELERLEKEFSLPAFAEEYLKVHPDQREQVEASHKRWLEYANRWLQNHSDFKLSYRFISGHPAFWHYTPTKGKDEAFNELLGSYDRSMEQPKYPSEEFLKLVELKYEECANFGAFYKTVFTKETGNIYDLECGQAIHPFLLSSYHNYSLDANGKSYEEAYSRVALNLYRYFGLQMSDDPASGYEFE